MKALCLGATVERDEHAWLVCFGRPMDIACINAVHRKLGIDLRDAWQVQAGVRQLMGILLQLNPASEEDRHPHPAYAGKR